MVEGSKNPTENAQSNFGVGYGYQYGAREGTIELYLNGKWRIYATEEVRREIQFPKDENDELPDREAYTANNMITGEKLVLNSQEGNILAGALDENWLSDASPSCDFDFEIVIIEKRYLYHSDCGTLFDIEGRVYKCLDEDTI